MSILASFLQKIFQLGCLLFQEVQSRKTTYLRRTVGGELLTTVKKKVPNRPSNGSGMYQINSRVSLP